MSDAEHAAELERFKAAANRINVTVLGNRAEAQRQLREAGILDREEKPDDFTQLEGIKNGKSTN